MSLNRRSVALLAACGFATCLSFGSPRFGAGSADEKRRFDPTDRYERKKIEGWNVLVNKDLLAKSPELADQTLDLLRIQLYQIGRTVRRKPLSDLKTITIWVEEDEPHHPCMAYHPDAGWLRDHDMNPDKARCVEIANAKTFLNWTIEQPWMVLHELAHGYHHQFLKGGFENREVLDAYRSAMKKELYHSVVYFNGSEKKAYATTNQQEYFAEASEAFLGTNDFYPFVRAELKKHDPKIEALLRTIWRGE